MSKRSPGSWRSLRLYFLSISAKLSSLRMCMTNNNSWYSQAREAKCKVQGHSLIEIDGRLEDDQSFGIRNGFFRGNLQIAIRGIMRHSKMPFLPPQAASKPCMMRGQGGPRTIRFCPLTKLPSDSASATAGIARTLWPIGDSFPDRAQHGDWL
jgi:hypothetical protein